MSKETTALTEPKADLRPPPEPNGGLNTPEELAALTGNVQSVREGMRLGGRAGGQRQLFSWQHEAASQLHGWKQHEHDAGEPFRLSREAYEAALKAASEPTQVAITRDGTPTNVLEYAPHRHALSPHAPAAKGRS
jgi:hypothetical protein